MLTTVNSFDITDHIDPGGIVGSQAIGDASSKLDIEVDDVGHTLSLDTGQEVILWDEQSKATPSLGSSSIASVPAHNLLSSTLFSSGWTSVGTLASGVFTVSGDGTTLTMTTANAAVGYRAYQQITPVGHVHPGQQYCFSCYVTIATAPTNASAFLQVEMLDNNSLSQLTVTNTVTSTTNNGRQRLSVLGLAQNFTTFVRVSVGGTTTNATNSAVFTFSVPQCEPMWFTGQGITYPTPDCTIFQPDCYQMPDGTVSRARIFSGYIADLSASDDGPNRTWKMSVASASMLLDTGGQGGVTGQINETFSAAYDDYILTTIVNKYYATSIGITAPNSVSPVPMVEGVQVGNVTYNDVTLRDVLNALIDQSGYSYYLDQYYTLNYTPAFYLAANFTLSDAPDNVTSFAYHDYSYQKDATQRKRQVKVIGNKFLAPAITDLWSGNGSTKQFTLSQAPYDVKSITIGGVGKRGGVWGVNDFTQGYDCLIDKPNLHLIWNVAPVSGSNNVAMNYTYEAPVTAAVLDQDAEGVSVAPPYVIPTFVAKVNDTSITDLATAIRRGLTEVTKWGRPQVTIDLKVYDHYARPGSVITLTNGDDGITADPYVVLSVGYTNLYGGLDEYAYTLGDYNPVLTLVDHVRQQNKALNKGTSTANATLIQQTDLACRETIVYSDSITMTVQSVYGKGAYTVAGAFPVGHYGSTAYGGQSGNYGNSTSRYNTSTQWS